MVVIDIAIRQLTHGTQGAALQHCCWAAAQLQPAIWATGLGQPYSHLHWQSLTYAEVLKAEKPIVHA